MKRLSSFILHNPDLTFYKHTSLMCVILVLLTFSPFDLDAAYSKHPTSIVEEVRVRWYYNDDYKVLNLTDPSDDKFYYSGNLAGMGSEVAKTPYVETIFKDDGLEENDAEDIVVYLRRTPNSTFLTINNAQPTAFGVKILFNDEEVEKISTRYIFNVHFLYRGPLTDEYSVRIPISALFDRFSSVKGKKITKLRFFPLATNNDSFFASRSNKFRDIALKRFDVLKIRHDEAYSDTNRDELHLTTDYLADIKDCEFINTRGVFDEPNRPSGWEEITEADENTLKSKGININFPDYKLLDSNTSTYPLASGQKRQPAHTVEHILYAMPGDIIPLYPYYDLPNPSINQFQENFSHWYDYKTGGRVYYDAPWNQRYDLLDFLNNPAKVQVTDKYGFFGGKGMNCSKEYKISTADQYKTAVTEINSNKNFGDAYIELTSDIDFGNRSDIPMLGDYFPFKGTFNGNGHKISNLVYNFSDSVGVGLIGKTEGNVLIENINLDESCKFSGSWRVGGIVGLHNSGTLTVRNIHSEAWVYGVRQNNEQNAGGILGACDTSKPTSINIEDCYIGGKIGNPETNIDHSFNAVVIGGLWATTGISTFKNIIVDCELTGRENLGYPNKVYIRHGQNTSPISIDANGIISKGNLRFKNCYGNIDPADECWKTLDYDFKIPSTGIAKLSAAGWNTGTFNPPVTTYTYNGYSPVYNVSSAAEYMNAVNQINTNKEQKAMIVLNDNITFSDSDNVKMIFEGYDWGNHFKGCINGNGHKISNLKIIRESTENVGLISWGGYGVRIDNLILDSDCKIQGSYQVGIIGRFYGDAFYMHNVKSEAEIRGKGNVGGVIGMCGWDQGNNHIELDNVYIGGIVGSSSGSSTNGAIVGHITFQEAISKSTLNNVIVNCSLNNSKGAGKVYIGYYNAADAVNTVIPDGTSYKTISNSKGNFVIEYTNCYGNLDTSDPCWTIVSTPISLPSDIKGWTGSDMPFVKEFKGYEKLRGNGDRLPGTMATFFCPRNPYDNSLFQSLPLNGEKEYVIAADFSQRFDPLTQISNDEDKVVIQEPAIAFRHIFRIRDGKAFADEISGSIANNENYIRRNQKRVSARSNVPFQIRLDFPHPKVTGSSSPQSNYYYKISDDEYGRVYDYDIIVFDENRTELSGKQGFYFGAPFNNQGTRAIDERTHYYFDAANTKEFNRMLLCTSKNEGHYIVQIVGKDKSGGIIKIFDSETHQKTEHNLVLMEYNIIFLPPKGGTMLTEEELYSKDDDGNSIYETAQVEYLNENFGGEKKEPTTYIDFDEYFKINQLTGNDALKNKLIAYINYDNGHYTPSTPTPNGKESSYFKWPVPWNQSNYSFGYNIRQDYNMYMLATHSNCVPYMESAKTWKKNMPGDYDGLYDRSYYASMRKYKMESQTRAASSEDVKQGYFYYVNAASDPGVTARLTINDLCQGSTIHVSAWMAEFSKDIEKANLSFNFVAVLADGYETAHPGSGLKGGDRVVLHSFITGEVKKTGEWLNVYYSFVPRLAEFSNEGIVSGDVDHYEVELDNNAKSSSGADYAIDDIRVYLEPPTVEAQQLTPACRDERMRMLLGSPFETLLEVAGKRESIGGESEELDVYYTYLDKELFDNLYYQEKKSMDEAFNASIITYNYNISGKDDRTFGKITFNGNYSINDGYHEDDEDIKFGKAYSLTKESGQRMIVFESEISSGKLLANKHYYVIFKSSLGENDVPTIGQEASFFNMSDPCANTCVTYIKPPIITKINGTIVADVENIRICENQSPVIQVNLTGIDDDNEPFDIDKNVYFDWFYGSKEELDRYTDGNDDTHTLYRALTALRLRHDEEVMLDTIKTDDNLIEGEKFEQWMLDLIKKASKPEGNSSIAKLSLYLSSFVMPPARMQEDGKPFTHYVTVLPIACVPLGTYKGDSTKLVCSTPTPIPITVDTKSPLLRHGLTGLEYPDDMTDVPLRIGIDQLKTNLADGTPDSRRIDLPVRLTLSSDDKSKALRLIKERTHKFVNDEVKTVEEEGAVVLVQTNDPEYKDLGTLDKDSIEIGTLFWVGEIKKIQAKTNQNETNQNETKQYVQLEFDKSFNFKEGYMYKFRFQYEETEVAPNDTVCTGQDVFTIKVVPKYLAWTGAENVNWNNDANWRRVGKTDLFMDDRRANAMAHYVTNGYRGSAEAVNPNVMAYAPLDFTSVIVESGMEAPFMYPMSETKEVKDEYQPASVKYNWPSDPEKSSTTIQDDDEQDDDSGAEDFGKVTPLIHYDMAAFEFDDNNRREQAHIGCRPWYANTCDEIHFKPGGTIMNQQELIYKKAWVDMELNHSRWYTVSSPLQEVYAGDFYLPSDGARQATELYQDMTFSKGTNDRFRPAVYQRGWDKGEAKVYEYENQSFDSPRNVAVKTFWSHVYNDVTEQYGGGVGFSIKTDISDMTVNKPNKSGKVLFRLPKADTKYLYYNKDGSQLGHETGFLRGDSLYRLNKTKGTLRVTTKTEGKYFLVGNPFMTHMDIQKFLETNNDKLEQKYWVITKSGQIAGGVDESGKFIAADPTDEEWAEDPTVIAPMQGFFVKTTSAAQSVVLTYDESMMRRYDSPSDHSGEYLTETTRSMSNGMLRIVAENYGAPSSAALLGVNDGHTWNVEAIDNRDIDIPSIVYTVGNGMALSINSVKEAEGTEIGVIADEDTETVIRFEGVEAVEGLYLLDKADHSLTPLEEGLEVAVEGSAAGRFFLTYGIADEGVMSGIEWSVNGGVLTAVDNAASGIIEVNVYDTMGRLVKHASVDDNTINVSLDSGICVVEISTAKERETAKIKIGR